MESSEPIDPLVLIGQVCAGHRVLAFCGNGAAGYVYEAEGPDGRVALKIYKDWLFEINAETQDNRIARESALRRVAHRNVCRVFDHGSTQLHGTLRRFLVMEFIQGDSLEIAIKRGIYKDWRVFADTARQLVHGIAALHAEGSIHRDIKPANVMLERGTGRVVITDFGVVADLEATTLLTEGHEFLGTTHYAAPEWLYRMPPEAAHQPTVDIYSLGATLLEMMTGRKPFDEIRNRHQLGEAVRNSVPTVNSPAGYPSEIGSLIRGMLAKAPDARPGLAQVDTTLARLAEFTPAVLDKPLPGDDEEVDPFEQYRRVMAAREDVRRAAERERFMKSRWGVFEPMWRQLDSAWNLQADPLSNLPGVAKTGAVWRGGDDARWANFAQIQASFPDRSWSWGRSFDIELAAPAVGAHCCYFFHGFEDDVRTGITRFVATLVPDDSRHPWLQGDAIAIESAASWMGSFTDALDQAITDVPNAKRLLLALLIRANTP